MNQVLYTFKAGKWAAWSDNLDEKCQMLFCEHYGKGPFPIFHVINNQDTAKIVHHQLVEVEVARNHFVIFPGNYFVPAKKPPGRRSSKSRKTSK